MRHVLIVDADARAANAMAGVVAAEGFTCAVARSLREAHGQSALQRPTSSSSTCELPDGSGMEISARPGRSARPRWSSSPASRRSIPR